MKKLGNIILISFSLITLGLWLLSKPALISVSEEPLISLAQISGLLASVFVSAEFLLATRVKVLEKLFHGLDKVYKAHAITGALAFLFMLSHPMLLAINALPGAKGALIYFIPNVNNPSYAAGIFGLYLMILFLVLTLFLRLPYHIWKRTHIFMAIPQVVILFHVAIIDSDVSSFLPLRIWILGLGAISLVAYAYKRFFYSRFGNRYWCTVSQVKIVDDLAEISLKFENKKMEFLPGQFVFLSIQDKTIGKEEHPFSISSAPQDLGLRLSIRQSGDYTKKLALTKVGMKAKIYGPYGVFGEKSLTKSKDDIWIAGGIGVTPFLSLLRHYKTTGFKKNVWMFFSTRPGKDLIYSNEIVQLGQDSSKFHYYNNDNLKSQRLTAKLIQESVGDLTNKQIFLCGPQLMVQDLWEQFLDLGVKPKNLIFEEFNFLP